MFRLCCVLSLMLLLPELPVALTIVPDASLQPEMLPLRGRQPSELDGPHSEGLQRRQRVSHHLLEAALPRRRVRTRNTQGSEPGALVPSSLLEALQMALASGRRGGPRQRRLPTEAGLRWHEPAPPVPAPAPDRPAASNITESDDCACDAADPQRQRTVSFSMEQYQPEGGHLLELHLPVQRSAAAAPAAGAAPLRVRLTCCTAGGAGGRSLDAPLRLKKRRPGWARALLADQLATLQPRPDECLQLRLPEGGVSLDVERSAVLSQRPGRSWGPGWR